MARDELLQRRRRSRSSCSSRRSTTGRKWLSRAHDAAHRPHDRGASARRPRPPVAAHVAAVPASARRASAARCRARLRSVAAPVSSSDRRSRSPCSRRPSDLAVPQLYDAAARNEWIQSSSTSLRRARTRLLGSAARRAAGACAHRQSPAGDLVRRRDGAGLDPGDRARVRDDAGLHGVPLADRPAARRRRSCGCRDRSRTSSRRSSPSTAGSRALSAAEPRPEELSWT